MPVVLSSYSVVFEFKGAGNALLLFQEDPLNETANVCMVEIGGGDHFNRVAIYKSKDQGSTTIGQTTISGMTSKDEFRPFWIRWYAELRNIYIGRSLTVGDSQFYSTGSALIFNVNALSISTSSANNGSWQFHGGLTSTTQQAVYSPTNDTSISLETRYIPFELTASTSSPENIFTVEESSVSEDTFTTSSISRPPSFASTPNQGATRAKTSKTSKLPDTSTHNESSTTLPLKLHSSLSTKDVSTTPMNPITSDKTAFMTPSMTSLPASSPAAFVSTAAAYFTTLKSSIPNRLNLSTKEPPKPSTGCRKSHAGRFSKKIVYFVILGYTVLRFIV